MESFWFVMWTNGILNNMKIDSDTKAIAFIIGFSFTIALIIALEIKKRL